MRQFLHELLFAPSRWAVVTFAKRTVWLLVAYLVGLVTYAAGWTTAHAQGLSGTAVGISVLSVSMAVVGLYVAVTTTAGDRIRASGEPRRAYVGHDAETGRVEPTFGPVPVQAGIGAEPSDTRTGGMAAGADRDLSDRHAA